MLDKPSKSPFPTTRLPGEAEDIKAEVAKFFDDPDLWLATPNDNLAGEKPEAVITAGNEAAVRDLLRRIKYIGVS